MVWWDEVKRGLDWTGHGMVGMIGFDLDMKKGKSSVNSGTAELSSIMSSRILPYHSNINIIV